MRIMPGAGAERGGSQIYEPNELEKNIVHARILNNFQQPMEVEGEVHFERRTQMDLLVTMFNFVRDFLFCPNDWGGGG